MRLARKLFAAFGLGQRAIAWDHGKNRQYECFGEDLSLTVDAHGPYQILEARSPALRKHVGKRISIKSRAVTKELTDILVFVDTLLEKHHIPHWINSGTLLGAWRHQNVVPWDNDGDIMIRVEDAEVVASLRAEIQNAGYLFGINKKFGPGYKIYVKSSAMPKIMVEICSMYPHHVTLEDGSPEVLWTYHPCMVERVKDRVERIYKTDPTNEIGRHRFTQRQRSAILIDNQYLTSEIFPIQRVPFAEGSIAAPSKPEVILLRDYGEGGLTQGLVSCACQWTDGDYLLKVSFAKP